MWFRVEPFQFRFVPLVLREVSDLDFRREEQPLGGIICDGFSLRRPERLVEELEG